LNGSVLPFFFNDSRNCAVLKGFKRNVLDVELPFSRALLTSAGLGINVFRYLASGVMNCVVREQKCLLKSSDAAISVSTRVSG
jgi:hypothetical protein